MLFLGKKQVSCVWQEGNMVSPGHPSLPFPLYVTSVQQQKGLWWFGGTFCSSRIPKIAHCLVHRHHIFVHTGSPDFPSFSFDTDCALVYKTGPHPRNWPFTLRLCFFARQRGAGGTFAVNLQCIAHGPQFCVVGVTRYICASVSVCCCRYMNTFAFYHAALHR